MAIVIKRLAAVWRLWEELGNASWIRICCQQGCDDSGSHGMLVPEAGQCFGECQSGSQVENSMGETSHCGLVIWKFGRP